MTKAKRSTLGVDPEVQGTILRRIPFYAVWCLLFINIPLLIAMAFLEPDRMIVEQFGAIGGRFWPIYVTLLAMLPFIAYDVLKLSNRFVSPVFRLRRELRRFAKDGDFQPVRFPDADVWNELAEQYNHLVGRVKAAEERLAALESTQPLESSSTEATSVKPSRRDLA